MEQRTNPTSVEPRDLTFEQRLKFAEIEIAMIQSRFDKFDQQFQGNRKLAVTITAAALAASTALDRSLVLLAACGSALIFLGLEIFQRRTLFARLVERHLLLRAALNDPSTLLKLVIYDPFNDTSVEVTQKWRQEKSRQCLYEMYIFYLALAAVPLLALLLLKP